MAAKTFKVQIPPATLFSQTTAQVFMLGTPWMDASEFDQLRGVMELRGRTGTIVVSLGYQCANVENSVDTATAFTSVGTADGVVYPSGGYQDIETKTGKRRLVRLGYLVNLTTGTTLALVRVAGKVDVVSR